MTVEPRLKAGVVVVAGLMFQKSFPEVEPLHYLQRVKSAASATSSVLVRRQDGARTGGAHGRAGSVHRIVRRRG